MHTPAVPNHNQPAAQLAMYLLDKFHYVHRGDVVIEQPEVQADSQRPRGQTQRAQHAEPVVPVPGILHGRLPTRGPGAATKRLQHEPTFVEKHDASFSRGSLFLSAASPPVANAGSPFRLAHGHAARASARSSPTCAAACLRNPRGRSRRTTSEPPPALADRSTARSGSRWLERRVAACGSAAVVVCPSTATGVGSEGPSPSPPCLGLRTHLASVSRCWSKRSQPRRHPRFACSAAITRPPCVGASPK